MKPLWTKAGKNKEEHMFLLKGGKGMLKKKLLKGFVSLILSLVIILSSIFSLSVSPMVVYAATQATYYVSPTGSDSNPGTLAAPFQTITKARDVVRTINSSMTGDIHVYLRGGQYRITDTIKFGPQDSGTNGYQIYYEAYNNEVPVINGATQVTGWSVYKNGIYKATLNRDKKLRSLIVNDKAADMTMKTITAQGGYNTYTVTAGQASWAWSSGSKSDGVKYNLTDLPAATINEDDIEIMNGTTWNENIVCARDLYTTSTNRVLLLQQPYGAIAQTPGWGTAFTITGSHKIYNVFEWLDSPGEFYFDKSSKTLYYYPRTGEDMANADVEAPTLEQLINISGTSTTDRVKNINFQGITFANSDYNLVDVAGSHGRATVQTATAFIAFGDGNWHNSTYRIIDTLQSMIGVTSSESINFYNNVIKNSGCDGISMVNDVVNCKIIGNYFTNTASSSLTIGHPQHVYIGDGGTHEKYAPGIEGVCKDITVNNNMFYDICTAPGFGGIQLTHNTFMKTASAAVLLGWGWCNFNNSTTCRNNKLDNNRLIDTVNRTHDSGALYTLGQQPGTTINENYVKGIPSQSEGPTYGLHNDEGSAYITENDNVLDIDPNVKYTINCEDYGQKHDLTIRRTYATVNKMGVNPPNSTIDTPIVVSDNVWPLTQYTICVNSGVQEAYRNIIPSSLLSTQDYVFPASCAASAGANITIRSSGNSSNSVWFAPAGTTTFIEGPTMTRAGGTAMTIAAPATAGTYRLCIVNSAGAKIGESTALLRVSGSSGTSSSYKFEAESAALSGGAAINTNHSGYSGTGFVDGYVTQGATSTFNVSVPSQGTYNVDLRYSAGNGAKTVSIYVNGAKIKQTSLTGTSNWDTWSDKVETLTLNAGSNTITYKYDSGDSGWINIDYISLPVYQAENATLSGGAKVNTDHKGYSGTGFVDGYWTQGATTSFNVSILAQGSFKVDLRYSAGNGAQTVSIYVNGTKVKQASLTGTSNWDTWGDKIEPLTLNVGNNTITYKYDSGDSGWINIDSITIR